MAKTQDYLDYLDENIEISPANSQEEFQAAQTISEVMRDHGLETSVEEFDSYPIGSMVPAILTIVMFVSLLVTGLTEGVLHVLTLVLAIASVGGLLASHFLPEAFESIGPSRRSQNVVGLHRAQGDKVTKGSRTIVIVAHYDSPRENILRNNGLGSLEPMLNRVFVPCVSVVGLAVLIQILAFLPDEFRRVMWVVGLVVMIPLIGLAIVTLINRNGSCSLGANDNKSSVGALLAIINKVRPGEDRVSSMAPARESRQSDSDAQVGPALIRRSEVVEEVKGVRHGAQVMNALGILPPSCELVYEEPRVRIVEEVAEEAAVSEKSEPEDEGIQSAVLSTAAAAVAGSGLIVRDDDDEYEREGEVEHRDEDEDSVEEQSDDEGESEAEEEPRSDEDHEPSEPSADEEPKRAADDETASNDTTDDEDDSQADETDDRETDDDGKEPSRDGGESDYDDDYDDEDYDDEYDDDYDDEYDDDYDDEYDDDYDDYEDDDEDEDDRDGKESSSRGIGGWISNKVASIKERFSRKDREEADFEIERGEDRTAKDDDYDDEYDYDDDDDDYEDEYDDEIDGEYEEYVPEEDEEEDDAKEEDGGRDVEENESPDDGTRDDEPRDDKPQHEQPRLVIVRDGDQDKADTSGVVDQTYGDPRDFEYDEDEEPGQEETYNPYDRFADDNLDEDEDEERREDRHEDATSEEPVTQENYTPQVPIEDDAGKAYEEAAPTMVGMSIADRLKGIFKGFDRDGEKNTEEVAPVDEEATAGYAENVESDDEGDRNDDQYDDDYYDDEYYDDQDDGYYDDERDERDDQYQYEYEDEYEDDERDGRYEEDRYDGRDDRYDGRDDRYDGRDDHEEENPYYEDSYYEDSYYESDEESREDEAIETREDDATSTDARESFEQNDRAYDARGRGMRQEPIESEPEATYVDDPEEQEVRDDNIKTERPEDPNKLHFDREEDDDIIPRDTSGLDTISDSYDLYDNDADVTVEDYEKPEPIDDPSWGTTSFQPARPAINIARRAALFDLPDPSAATVDPLADDDDYEYEYDDRDDDRGDSERNDADNLDRKDENGTSASGFSAANGNTDLDTDPSSADKSFWKEGKDKPNGWKGGATVRADLRDGNSDEPIIIDADDLQDAILEMDDDFLVAHDIWFVATGSSEVGHAGIKAFIKEHHRDIRGAFLINLECIGAGTLSVLSREGIRAPRRADRRLLRLLTDVAKDLHIKLDTTEYDWNETESATAMRSRIRSVTISGMDENDMQAFSASRDDVPENVSPKQVYDVVRMVTELIRRS